MGESSGTSAADATAHGNAGTYAGNSGGFTLAQSGAIFGDSDTAVKFDGSSGHVLVPNSSGLQTNQVTIELWIKKLSETPWGAYVTKNIAYGGHAGSGWFQLLNFGSTGRLQFRVTGEDSLSTLQSATTLSLNNWYYVVATYDGTTAKLYVNGSLDGSLGITATPAQTSDPLYLGRRPDGYYTNAVFDEVAMYSSALSLTQIGSHWVASGNPPGSPTSVSASTPGSNQATVSWTDPANAGASAITGYTVTPHVGSTLRTPITVSGAGATQATMSGLSSGSYTFTVVANNASGSSPPSAASSSLSVSGALYGYAAAVLGDSPAAYWRLGEVSGVVATDATGQGDTGTYFGGRTQNQPGAIYGDPDPAVSFDGSTGYVIAPSSSSLPSKPLTIELWLKKSTETPWGAYISKNFSAGAGAGTGWFQLLNFNATGRLQFRVTGDTQDVSLNSATALNLNTWYYVVATYDGTTAKLYLNGSLNSSLALTATPAMTTDPLYIARRADGSYNSAAIDEVAIYPTALSAAQVTGHWRAAAYVPGAPSGAAASLPSGTTNQAQVSWTAPSSGASTISSYTVSTQGGPTQIAPATVTASPATVTGLSGGSAYTFTVVATNSYGDGPASSATNSVTPSGNALATGPTNPAATGGNAQATVSWTPPSSNGGSAIVSYAVTPYAGTTPGTTTTVQALPQNEQLGLTYTTVITGLTNGTSYTFQIVASNAVGPGPPAATGSITPATSPGAPTNVVATAGNAQAVVSWTAPANGGAVITSYTITPYAGIVPGTPVTVSGSTTTTTVTGLTNGLPYTFQVTATNSAGTSLPGISNAVTPTAPAANAPGPPTTVTATAGNTQVTVSWSPPSSNGGSAITGYTVTPYVGTTAGTPVSASGTSATITGLTNGTTYVIYVTATNSAGIGPAGTSNPVTPTAVPGAPTAVTATAGNTQVTVAWTAPASSGGTVVNTYTVTPFVGSTPGTPVTISGGTTSVIVTGLLNGTTYTVTVSATNSAGNSPVGTSNAVTPAAVPDPPTAVTAASGNLQATVSWTPPSGNGSALSGYTVTPYIGSTAGTSTSVSAPASTAQITGLTNGTSYTFQVTASNAMGTGAAGISNAVIVGSPTPPTNVSATSGVSNQATVTWTAASGGSSAVSGYVITAYIGLQAENAMGTGASPTSVTMTGLSGATYTFQVAAINSSGSSLGSAASGSVVVSGGTTYASTILGDGPAFYYRLGESGGTVAADSSGNGHSAKYVGTYTLGAAGALVNDTDAGVTLSGGTVQYPSSTGLPNGNAARSVEAWVKSSGSGTQTVVGYGTTVTRMEFQLQLVGANQVQLFSYNDDRVFTAPYVITNGGWHHLVVTYDGASTPSMYLDGLSLGTGTYATPLSTSPDTSGLVAGSNLTGTVDEVAVYPTALTAGQVANHFSASGNSRSTAPSGVTASSSIANQATVTWTASTGSAGAPVTGYVVTAYSGTQPQNSVAVGGSTLTATMSGLNGATYTFKALAINNFGNSPPSTASGSVVVSGGSTYASTVLGDGPAFFYRLGETGGTLAADSSGNGRPARYSGSSTLGAAGALVNDADPGVTLSGGTVQYQSSTGLPNGNSARSVEAWVKTTATGTRAIVGWGTSVTRMQFQLHLVGTNQIILQSWNDDRTFTAPYVITNGGWHQIVVTYDGVATLTMYLDGASLGSGTYTTPLNTGGDANGLVVGSDEQCGSGCNSFSGSIDEVAVYPTALSGTQVANHFTASGNSRPTAPGGVSASSGAANQATVSWTASTASAGAPVTGYVVTTYNGTQAQNSMAVGGSTLTATVSGLKGATYTFRVLATNNFGNSPLSGASGSVLVSGGTTYASTVQADGAVAYLRLDDSAVTWLAESSGITKPGQYVGGYTLGQTGALLNDADGAAKFDGASGYGVVPNSAQLQSKQITLELWVKKLGQSDYGMYLTKNFSGCGGAGSSWFQLMNNGTSGHLEFRVTGDCGTSLVSNAVLGVNSWYHVVATYDGTTAKLYINGSLDSSMALTATPAQTSDPIYLARRSDGFYNNVVLDEVAIYPTALTAAQVGAHFAASGNSALPAAPSTVSAVGGNAQASVSWLAPSANGSPLTSYTVTPYVGSTPGTPVTVSGSPPATSTTVTGLTNGTTYTFQVTATNGVGTGSAGVSNAVLVGAPGAPTSVIATPGNAQAAVSWTAPPANGSGITSYTVTPYIGSTAGTPVTVTGTPPATSTTVMGLTNGTTYTFQVTATNATGTGPAGASTAVMVGSPSAPTSVVASIPAGNNQVTVTWTGATANGLAITGYVVTAYTGLVAVNSTGVGPTTTSVTISGLVGSTNYTFQVWAMTSAGNGPASTASNSVAPTGVSSTYASTVIQDGPVAYYRLGDSGGATAGDSSGNGNQGTFQGGVTLTQAGALGTDTDTAAQFDGSSGAVQVSSTASLQANQVTIELWLKKVTESSYGMYVTKNFTGGGAGSGWFELMNSGTTGRLEFRVTGDSGVALISNATLSLSTWYYVVATYDGATAKLYVNGSLDSSLTLSATPAQTTAPLYIGRRSDGYYNNAVLDEVAIYPVALTAGQVTTHLTASGLGPPSPPTGVTATAGANQAAVSWTAPQGGINRYVVSAYLGAQALNSVAVGGSTTSVTVTGLKGGSSYTFQVTATNNFGTGPAGVSGLVTPTGVSTTYASTVLQDVPTVYYRLDDQSVTAAADSSGNGRMATYGGTYTQSANGALTNDSDMAVSLNGGTVQYVGTGLPLANNPRTLEAWVSAAGAGGTGTQGLVGYGSANGARTLFDLQLMGTNQLRVVTSYEDKVFTAPYTIANGNWHHVVSTYDGTTLTVYLDGISMGSATFGGAFGTVLDSNGLVIGRDSWSGADPLNGSIDEVAVYNTWLTSSQVTAHFNASGNARPAAPTAVTATPGANQATVNWTAPSGPVTGYVVTGYIGLQAQNSTAVAGSTTTTITGLRQGTGYTFQVMAYNNFGNGPLSASSTSVTPTGTAGATYASTILGDSPSIYYRLDDPSGSVAADSSGNGRPAIYSGTATLGAIGALSNDSNKAASVNAGAVQYASSAGLPTANSPRTLEVWVKPLGTGSSGIQGLLGYGTASTRSLFDIQMVGTTQIRVVTSYDDKTFTGGYPLTNGVWHQVVATYDGSTLAVYLDGQSLGTATFGGALGTVADANGLVAGRDSWTATDWLNGGLDEIAVYPTALSGAQIGQQVANHWNASGWVRPGAPTNLVAWAAPRGATLSWTAPALLGNPPLTGYTITPFAGSTPGTALAVAASPTTATVSGLIAGGAYTYQIKANSPYDPAVLTSGSITASNPVTAPKYNSSYKVYVGYTNTIEPGFFTPSPWSGSPNATFVGSAAPYDSSAVRISNLTSNTLTIGDVSVDIGPSHFDLWGSNLNVPANGDLILTQTSAYNFDGSDTPVTCQQSGYFPMIQVTMNGSTTNYQDTAQILNTGGIDTASCGGAEGSAWQEVGNPAGPSLSEIWGYVPDIHICWKCLGLPVNTATGDFWHSFTDFAIPGRGLALNFVRTYNSQGSGADGRLGFGWTDSYNVYLAQDGASGNAVLHEEGGSTVTFAPKVGGGYQAPSRVLATLTKNPDGTFTFKRFDNSSLAFDARGELTAETDRNGYATSLSYDNNNHLQSITDPSGRALTITFSSGRISAIGDPAGRTASFQYDALGNLVSATDIGGAVTRSTYDVNHQLLTMTDPNGGTVTNAYDSLGRAVSQTDAMHRVTLFTYSPGQTTIADPNGNNEIDQYQANQLISVTKGFGSAQAATWTYTYDQNTLGVTSVVDPNGHTTGNGWDVNGNLLTSADGLSRARTYTYNGLNEVLTHSDPLGVTTTDGYDAAGNVMKISTPLSGTTQYAVTSFQYDPAHPGDVSQMTDANGKVWQFGYDSNGVLNKSVDPLGNTTTYSYDSVGRLQSSVSPNGNATGGNPAAYTTSFTTTAFGDRLTTLDPAGNRTTYSYDANRNIVAVTDANGHATSYAYDADNEPTQVVRADGSMLKTSYDSNGNVTQQIDGLGNSTTYQYDSLNRRTKMTDPLNRSTIYGYDGVGNLATLRNPKDSTTSYSMGYDAANELKTITYSDAATANVSFQYDLDGQRQQMTDTATGSTTYIFDSLHRLTQSTDGSGSQVSYGYDLLGHVTRLVYPGGTHAVTRTYDDAGRLSSVTDWLNNTARFSYDANSNLTGQSYPNGVHATFSYDPADRLIQVVDTSHGSSILNLSYSRDGTSQLSGENSAVYGYDQIDRLTTTATGNAATSYAYDAGDNPAKIVNGSTTTTNVYDVANELLTATTVTGQVQTRKYTYAYDANGNRTSRSDQNNVVLNFGYDQANRLTSYGSSTTYSYNGDGLRVSKTVSASAEPFTWDLADGMPLLIKDGSTTFVTGQAGLPLEQITSTGAAYYYHQDQLGTTRALSDASGSVVATYAYDAYGNLLGSTGAVNNPFGYGGEYTDSESGLMYLRARYYEPSSQLFITRDPLAASTRQPYAYITDSPLNGTDPSGLDGPNWGGGWNAFLGATGDLFLKPAARNGAQTMATVVGGAHDYLIDTQSNLLSGDPGRMAKGALQSLGASATIVGSAAVVRAAIRLGFAAFAGEDVIGSCTAGQLNWARNVLAQGGRAALTRSRVSLLQRIAQHQAKIQSARAAGGFTSSMEAEISNFQGQINAIDYLLGGGS